MKEDKGKDQKTNEKMRTDLDNGKCNDKKCHIHGNVSVRGRKFKGHVVKIYEKKVTIEFERFIYIPKYERYAKTKTRLHAHLPDCLASQIKLGDAIEIGECRPLSKMIHHVVLIPENKDKTKEKFP